MSAAASASNGVKPYYIPHEGSLWPAIGCVGMLLITAGASNWINDNPLGPWTLVVGLAIVIVMFFAWFNKVISESLGGLYNQQMDMTFRWSMGWFIFSEVMFFAAFFGALYYARQYSIPWLSGEGNNLSTNLQLWPGFEKAWPTNGPAELGGEYKAMAGWAEWGHGFKAWFWESLPLVNTAILLTSGVTLTFAHWAVFSRKQSQVSFWLFITVALGVFFLYLQAAEYHHAYAEMGLTLGSGIYGSTFFMLTGFHGMHVTLGAIMLLTQFFRSLKGHLTPENHFSFEAVAWYWHFVDVVWLGLFIFVYIL